MTAISRRAFIKGAVAASTLALGHALAPRYASPIFLPQRKSNLIIVTSDTTRAESLNCYGCPVQTMPNVDRLAGEGVLFVHAYSPATCTAPGHASLFSGLFPDRHGVVDNFRNLPKDVTTLAEILRTEGYTCAAFLGTSLLNRADGLAKGFHLIDWRRNNDFPKLDYMRRSGSYLNEIIAFIRNMRNTKSPFFLWIHSFDPHAPYSPPDKYSEKFVTGAMPRIDIMGEISQGLDDIIGYHPEFPPQYMLSQYYGELSYWDDNLGKILEALQESPESSDTLLVFTSDHGENVGEGGVYGHFTFNPCVTQIPMLLRHPERLPNRKIETPAQLTDLVPTILAFLNLDYDARSFDGENLLPIIMGRQPEAPDRPVYLINLYYDSAAIIDQAHLTKIIKEPCGYEAPATTIEIQQKPIPEFTDSIIEANYTWKVSAQNNKLLYEYSGRILQNLDASSALIFFLYPTSTGDLNLAVDQLRINNQAFTRSFTWPRIRRPDIIDGRIVCDFCTTIKSYRRKYCVAFLAQDGEPVYISPWIHYKITDEHGIVAKPPEGSRDKVVDLHQSHEVEEGVPYDAADDPYELMNRLQSFLVRAPDLRVSVREPEFRSDGTIALPGDKVHEDMSPKDLCDFYKVITDQLNLIPELTETIEELKALGYSR